MKKYKKYLPYIRRANGNETAETFRDAVRLEFYKMMGKPFYVIVQHGFPNNAIAVGASKYELKNSILPINLKQMKFKEWSKTIQKKASK